MSDVVGFGALNLDRLYYVEKFALAGGHQPIVDVFECPGGSAANTVAWLADDGFKTGFLGAVGSDGEGRLMLDDFQKRKVDASQVKTLDGRTGVVVGFVDSSGERTLYPYPGVNDEFMLDGNALSYVSKSKFLHLSPFVGDRQFNEQKKLVDEISPSVKVSFSPGDLYVRKGLDALETILSKTSVLFLNLKETEHLTGLDYRKGCVTLNKLGVETVAVTLGARGCYVYTAKEKTKAVCSGCTPLDTTGAGDAFTAGFLGGLLQGKTVEECGVLGNQTAEKCIRHYGARPI